MPPPGAIAEAERSAQQRGAALPSPRLSVVVPTYNRLVRWPRLLDALINQTCGAEAFELVVVSDGSTDGTDELLRSLKAPFRVVFASQPNRGPAAARNLGVELASGPLVLFLDDDVVPTPDLIREHLRTHELAGPNAVVIGPMATPPHFEMSAAVRWEQAMLYKQYEAMANGDWAPSYRQFFTGNASVSRSAVTAAGGFDARFRRAEDIELAYRLREAGFRFVFDERAVGYHYAERSFRTWLENAQLYGANDIKLARLHPNSWIPQQVRTEFRRRHPFVRSLTMACVAQPRLRPVAQELLRGFAILSEVVKARALTRRALSGLYNVSYYCGIADEVGGAGAFRELTGSTGIASPIPTALWQE